MVKLINKKRQAELAVELIDGMFASLENKHFIVTSLIKSGCDWTHLQENVVRDIPRVFAECFELDADHLAKQKAKDTEIAELKRALDTEKTRVESLLRDVKRLESKVAQAPVGDVDVEYLVERDKILTKLEIGGVDNWEWYSESLEAEDDE